MPARAWRLSPSLDELRKQVNEFAPNRSKISDGTIGDAAHASRKSHHNPDSEGFVRGLDITHDLKHNVDGNLLAEEIIRSKDVRLDYIIWNRQICSGPEGPSPWMWRKYTGTNPHTKHVHISVRGGAHRTSIKPWIIDLGSSGQAPQEIPTYPVLAKGTKGPDVERLQNLLNKHGAGINPDSDFGPKTRDAVRAFQRKKGLVVDGIVGPYTWEKLLE